tara:strand:- start:59352 stop:60572 length:1221 start_codon:yes stop_codon:yes gene_type:complete
MAYTKLPTIKNSAYRPLLDITQLTKIRDRLANTPILQQRLAKALSTFTTSDAVKLRRKDPHYRTEPPPYSVIKTQRDGKTFMFMIAPLRLGPAGMFGVAKVGLLITKIDDVHFNINFSTPYALKIIRRVTPHIPQDFAASSAFECIKTYYAPRDPEASIVSVAERTGSGVSLGFRKIYIATPIATGIPLSTFINENPKLSLYKRLQIALAIANNIERLHTHRFVHRDLRTNHVIIYCEGKAMQVSFVDFDGAKHHEEKDSFQGGSYGYFSTRRLQKPYSAHTDDDIHAFGIIFIDILGCLHPTFCNPKVTHVNIYEYFKEQLLILVPLTSDFRKGLVGHIKQLVRYIITRTYGHKHHICDITAVITKLGDIIRLLDSFPSQLSEYIRPDQTWPSVEKTPSLDNLII